MVTLCDWDPYEGRRDHDGTVRKFSIPESLSGWDVQTEGLKVLCAYNPDTGELRINPSLKNNAEELKARVDEASCLLSLFTLGNMGGLPTNFTVQASGRRVKYSGILKKVEYLGPEQRGWE
jgi:hypothetical protein